MASINVSPLVMKDVTLNFVANGYEKHVSSVTFKPKSSVIRWQGLTPAAKFSDVTASEWECVIEYVQDWDTTNSLAKYLLANEGSTIACTFKPKAAGTPSFAANITITPGEIGGKVNAFATTSVTLGSDKPVLS